MFDQVVKRSNSIWIYKRGRFAQERRIFLCDLNARGHDLRTLRNVNKSLLAIAERVNIRQSRPITERQILRAAKDWTAKSCTPSSKTETRETATKRFVYVAKNWFRFLGKWRDPDRNPQFKPELDSFLKELREDRGYTDQTHLLLAAVDLNTIRAWPGHVSLDPTNIYAETDLALKARALAARDPGGAQRRIKKKWRGDPSLMEFLRRL